MSERDIDLKLVERVQKGDNGAFELLVCKYQRKLKRIIMYVVKNHAEAEDVVQEVFMKAYRSLSDFRGDSAFFTWLYRIGMNSAKNFLLTQRRLGFVDDADAVANDALNSSRMLTEVVTPESILASKQLINSLNVALNCLPQELFQAISLREIEGCSYEEIADMMKCPVGTVRSRIFRARAFIANKLRAIV